MTTTYKFSFLTCIISSFVVASVLNSKSPSIKFISNYTQHSVPRDPLFCFSSDVHEVGKRGFVSPEETMQPSFKFENTPTLSPLVEVPCMKCTCSVDAMPFIKFYDKCWANATGRTGALFSILSNLDTAKVMLMYLQDIVYALQRPFVVSHAITLKSIFETNMPEQAPDPNNLDNGMIKAVAYTVSTLSKFSAKRFLDLYQDIFSHHPYRKILSFGKKSKTQQRNMLNLIKLVVATHLQIVIALRGNDSTQTHNINGPLYDALQCIIQAKDNYEAAEKISSDVLQRLCDQHYSEQESVSVRLNIAKNVARDISEQRMSMYLDGQIHDKLFREHGSKIQNLLKTINGDLK